MNSLISQIRLNDLTLKSNARTFTNTLVFVTLTIGIFNARPAIIGQKYGEFFFVITTALFLFLLVAKKSFIIKREVCVLYLLYIFFYLYVCFQFLILDIQNYKLVLLSLLMISIGMYGFITYRKNIFAQTIATISYIFVAFSISYIVTYIMFLSGVEIQLTEITLPMRDDFDYIYPVYFPFSIAYDGGVRIFSEKFPRAIANFREPGLLQLIVIYLYWVNLLLKIKKYKFINFFLLVLLALTFSTAGYLCFAVSLLIYLISKGQFKFRKYFYAVLVIVFFSFLMLYTDTQFSMESKFSNQSGLVRLEAALVSFDLLREKPLLGIGFDQKYKDIPIGVNFLGTMAQIGIVGTFFLLLPFVYSIIVVFKHNKKYLTLIFPLLITLLFSQPLYDKAITIYFLATAIYLAKNEARKMGNVPV